MDLDLVGLFPSGDSVVGLVPEGGAIVRTELFIENDVAQGVDFNPAGGRVPS